MPLPKSRSGSYRRSRSERPTVDFRDDPPASGSAGQLRPSISLCIEYPHRLCCNPFSPAGSFDPAIAMPWSSPAPTMGARQPRAPASGRCSRPGPVPGARIWSRGLKSSQIRFSGLGSGGHSRGLGSGRVTSRHDFAIGDGPPGASCSAGRLC